MLTTCSRPEIADQRIKKETLDCVKIENKEIGNNVDVEVDNHVATNV